MSANVTGAYIEADMVVNNTLYANARAAADFSSLTHRVGSIKPSHALVYQLVAAKTFRGFHWCLQASSCIQLKHASKLL